MYVLRVGAGTRNFVLWSCAVALTVYLIDSYFFRPTPTDSSSPSALGQHLLLNLLLFFFFHGPFRGRDVSCETPHVMPHCTSGWSLRWFHHRLIGIVGTLYS